MWVPKDLILNKIATYDWHLDISNVPQKKVIFIKKTFFLSFLKVKVENIVFVTIRGLSGFFLALQKLEIDF